MGGCLLTSGHSVCPGLKAPGNPSGLAKLPPHHFVIPFLIKCATLGTRRTASMAVQTASIPVRTVRVQSVHHCTPPGTNNTS